MSTNALGSGETIGSFSSRIFLCALILLGLLGLSAVSLQATPVTFTGADNAVSSLAQMVNSQAAASSWNAAVGSFNVITFETALPPGVSTSGGSVTSNSGCGALCGFNTTSGGANFLLLVGGSATISFTNPINSLGFYVTGLQTDLVPQETLVFSDGSTQTINTPTAINGGGAFIGFTDFGKQIVSVTYNATNDIVAIDDVRYGLAAAATVPEPTSVSLLGLGLAGIAALRLRRRK
jgi:hypothetical protein